AWAILLRDLATVILSAGDGSDDPKRFRPRRDGFRQRRVGRLKRQVLLASVETQHWPAGERDVVANRAAQHRVARLQRVKKRALRGGAFYLELNFSTDVGQRAQVKGKDEADHLASSKNQK